jgi:hypothetical chaperone protein
MTPVHCGIDFGTSNSTVSLADGEKAWLMPVEASDVTVPSAVFWHTEGPPAFGRAAIQAYVDGEEGRLMRGLKSTLGSSLIDERTAVGARSVSFKAVLTAFFRHLRERIDAGAGPLTQVVLGRPVHFVDDDAAADARAQAVLEEIARTLGFKDIGFQYEPIAAALHYEQTVTAEDLVLIVDVGGGTSDFSVVRVSPERARAADRAGDILANAGIRVGGTDFDRVLSLAELMPHLGYLATTKKGQGVMPRHYYLDLATWHRINMLYTQRVASDLKAMLHEIDRPELLARLIRVTSQRQGHALAMAVEAGKIALSGAETVRLQVSALTGGPNPMASRARFDEVITPALGRITGTIAQVLADAGLTPDRIGTVFMTGGSSSLPALHACVRAALPAARIATGDMLGSVGTGLALEARRRFA